MIVVSLVPKVIVARDTAMDHMLRSTRRCAVAKWVLHERRDLRG